MVRLAVMSDLHLGFAYGSERGEDPFKAAEKAFDAAIKEEVNLILIPGDIFHDKIPKPEVLARAIELFSRVRKRLHSVHSETGEIPPIICIWGTHERRFAQSVNPVQLLAKAGLVYILHAQSVLLELRDRKIGVHGLSGVPENYARDALESWAPKPFKSIFNILMLHQNFQEFIPANLNMLKFADLPKGFDLYLLGHIHWRSEAKHPIFNSQILIPGSLIPTQLTKQESEREKGFYIIELEDSARLNFIPVRIRPFIYRELNVNGLKPSEIRVKLLTELNAILREEKTKPLVKFKLIGILAEGFSPSDLNVNKLVEEYKERALLVIDKSAVCSQELNTKSELLTKIKRKEISVEQLGLEILREQFEPKLELKKLERILNCLIEENFIELERHVK